MISELKRILRDKNALLFAVFMLIFPFYLWGSGKPQPSTLFMGAVLLITGGGGIVFSVKKNRYLLVPLWLFVAYTIVVNYSWFAILIGRLDVYANYMPLLPVFYIYNAAVVSFFLHAARRSGRILLVGVTIATLISVLFQVVASLLIRNAGFRGELFFNNPNQLGYYALLSATILALSAREYRRLLPIAVLGIAMCSYLAALSLSKAAMIGCLLLVVVTSVLQPKRVLPIAALLGLLLVPSVQKSQVRDRVESRMSGIGTDGDDTLAARGYDRIWKYPEYAILGAGESATKGRFDLDFVGEMHSSFGTILFSYGIPGIVLFGLFLFRVFRKIGFVRSLYLVPMLVYGTSHMGLRFTMFWIVIAFALGISSGFAKESQIVYLRRVKRT